MQKISYYIGLFIILSALLFLTSTYFPAGFGRLPAETAHPVNQTISMVPDPREPVRSEYQPGDIPDLCDAAIRDANTSFNRIAAIPPQDQTIDTTLLAFEQARAVFSDATLPLSFAGYVNPDPVVAAEGMTCEEKTSSFLVSTFTRRDLYTALKNQTPRNDDEARLYTTTIRKFERNGLSLPNDQLDKVRTMNIDLAGLESRFNANLNNDTTTLEFTTADLLGLSDEARSTFRKTDNGTYIVTLKYPDYLAVMQNAEKSETRKKMYAASMNIQAEENTRLLENAIRLRQEIAGSLGYASWADFRIEGRMAQNPGNVEAFLSSLKEPLKEKARQELSGLLTLKQAEYPGATSLDPWDISYYNERLRLQKYNLNEEEIREYFPLDVVLPGMFAQYETLFSIRFEEVKDAKVWAPEVSLYRIANATDNRTIAYVYFDLFPREGKYSGMMMSPLTEGRMVNGSYHIPVTAIIGDLRAPSGNVPSLLTHHDIEGLFHELGHTLHESLTTAPYASLSGANVEWDFAETPSQTLEEWTWDPQVMESISGHYTNHTQKLPADLRDKIIAARDMDAGIYYARQLMLATEDMEFSTAKGPVNVTEISDALHKEMLGIPPVEGGHEPAGIGHFMGGYDAGYYSYLWSEVYALNIYSRFKQEGLSNTTTGAEYRQWILEPGNMQDGTVLLKGFLHKDPGADVFYERLHIANVTGSTAGSGGQN